MREVHVRRTARERYAIDDALLGARGDLLVADLAAIRHLSARMNSVRPAGAPSVGAGDIVALGLLHEVAHLLTARLESLGRGAMSTALRDIQRAFGDEADVLLDRFSAAFPGVGPSHDACQVTPSVSNVRAEYCHSRPRREAEPGIKLIVARG